MKKEKKRGIIFILVVTLVAGGLVSAYFILPKIFHENCLIISEECPAELKWVFNAPVARIGSFKNTNTPGVIYLLLEIQKRVGDTKVRIANIIKRCDLNNREFSYDIFPSLYAEGKLVAIIDTERKIANQEITYKKCWISKKHEQEIRPRLNKKIFP